MSTIWQELLKYVGSVAVISAVAAFLIRSLILHFLSKDVESYKTKLKATTDREIEGLKTELAMTAKEHDIRFTKLHEKRVAVIAELYGLLEEANEELRILSLLVKAEIEPNELKGSASDAWDALEKVWKFYKPNKLYFPKELCVQVDIFIEKLGEPLRPFYKTYDSPEQMPSAVKKVVEAWHEERTSIDDTLESIEKQFRAMLGDNIHPASNIGMHPTADTKVLK